MPLGGGHTQDKINSLPTNSINWCQNKRRHIVQLDIINIDYNEVNNSKSHSNSFDIYFTVIEIQCSRHLATFNTPTAQQALPDQGALAAVLAGFYSTSWCTVHVVHFDAFCTERLAFWQWMVDTASLKQRQLVCALVCTLLPPFSEGAAKRKRFTKMSGKRKHKQFVCVPFLGWGGSRSKSRKGSLASQRGQDRSK